MAMELLMDVYVEHPSDEEKVIPAVLKVQMLERTKGQDVKLRLVPYRGDVEYDFFDIELDDLRVIVNSFSNYDDRKRDPF